MALNDPRPDIEPKYIACLIDISEHCSEEILARCGGKLYMSGFYDDNLNTYLCSPEPCIFVDVIELVPEKYPEEEPARDNLNCELIEAHTMDDSGYYGRRDIERRRERNPDHFQELSFTFDADDKPEDEVREHLQGNPRF
jgi:hypothetical protein